MAPGNEEQKQTLCRGWEDFTFAMMDKPRSLDSEQASSPATRSLAEAGDAKAQFSLEFCFASEGSAPDYLQAAQWSWIVTFSIALAQPLGRNSRMAG